MKKKLMCLSLVCVFVFSLLASTSVFAEGNFEVGDFKYRVASNPANVAVVGLSAAGAGRTGDFVLPSTISYGGNTYTVIGTDFAAFAEKKNITGFTLPDTFTSMGGNTFYGCSALKTVKLSSALTGEMFGTFVDCIALTSVSIPANVGNLYMTFMGCTNLTSVTFQGINNNPSNYYTDGVFDRCNSKLVVTAYAGSSAAQYAKSKEITVNEIFESGDFKYSIISGTDNVKVTGFSTASEKSGDYVLPPTVIHDSKTYTVTQISGQAFEGQRLVTSLTLPNTVTSIGYLAFKDMVGLTNFVMPDSVTTLSYGTFYACSNLEHVKLSKNLTGAMVETFSFCAKLHSCVIPAGVEELTRTFMYCHIINTVVIPASVTRITGDNETDAGARLFSTFENAGRKTGAPTEPGFAVLGAAGSAIETYMNGKRWNFQAIDYSMPLALKQPKFDTEKGIKLDVINCGKTAVTENLYAICAIYNKADNTLLDVVIMPINGGVSELKAAAYELTSDIQYSHNTMYAKSFVWSQNEFKPFSKSETLFETVSE